MYLNRGHSALPQSLESLVIFLKFTVHKRTPNRNFLKHRPQSIHIASTVDAFPTSYGGVLGFYQALLLFLVGGS